MAEPVDEPLLTADEFISRYGHLHLELEKGRLKEVGFTGAQHGPVPVGALRVARELVVEVKSPTDQWGDIFIKVGEYLNLGVDTVLVLDPVRCTASLYRSVDPIQQILSLDDVLTIGVLPGFSVPVRRLFE